LDRIHSRTLNTGLGIAAIALWSTTVALGRSLTEQLGTLTSACLIYLLGGIIGCAFLALNARARATVRSQPARYLIGCGSLFALYMVCLYGALGLARDRQQVLQVGLLNYLWPMLTLLLSVPVLRMRGTRLLPLGALVGTGGVFLAMTQSEAFSWTAFRQNLLQNSTPYLLGATAALSWALYSTLSRKWVGDSQGVTVPVFMLGTGLLLALARLVIPEETEWTRRALRELLFMAVGSNLAYVFWEQAMRQGDLVLVAACSYFTPLLSTMVSTLYLGILPHPRLWIGCALVIAGAITCKMALREPASETA
jgi:drug/metabolite transporter (DMT)-like permease